uniref:Lipase n=1 Tax=Mucor endophyticus TaxID=444774 RepID=A0A1B2LUC2_9FUNG|nr:lipase [Mucor endophyticus]
MVSFTSITQGIVLVSIVLLGSSSAAPAPGGKAGSSSTPTNDNVTDVAPHANATNTASFKLPPLISSRTRPASHPEFAGNLQAEAESIERNKQWFIAHGGNFNNITKRDDSNTVGGMTLDLPENAPPIFSTEKKGSVINASSAQIKDFKFHAALSASGYCRGVVPLGSWSCEQCLKYIPDGKLIVTFTTLLSDSNGYVLRSDAQKTIHLVFRGTNSIRNAVTDLTFGLTNYPPVKGAKVHTGFLASYNEVVGKFFPSIQAQLTAYPNYKVVVSGHSFGGAQALLAGMDLYQREKRLSSKNLSIYTVGCPRVGNPAFAYYVDSTGIPFSRSVNKRDVVPHLPPQSFGFLHPGVEAWTKSSNDVQICNSNLETNDCSNTIVPFTSIIDHLTYYDINQGLCL